MTVDDILLQTEEDMSKAVDFLKHEFTTVRTGKASPALVEGLQVHAYDSTMRLREIAGITAPEPRMLVIQPWDISVLDAVRKAIEASPLGVNPVTDGKVIRLPFPELSQQRREELVKVIRKMAEDQRVVARKIRREGIDALKKLQKDGNITEDDLEHGEEEIQKLTDSYVGKIDEAASQKEKELLTI